MIDGPLPFVRYRVDVLTTFAGLYSVHLHTKMRVVQVHDTEHWVGRRWLEWGRALARCVCLCVLDELEPDAPYVVLVYRRGGVDNMMGTELVTQPALLDERLRFLVGLPSESPLTV
jgi:hypothetical protein